MAFGLHSWGTPAAWSWVKVQSNQQSTVTVTWPCKSHVKLAQIAERTIHDDMEYLIKHTVDPRKADYAVISGIQIHSWGEQFDDAAPNLEYIAPCSVYCVVAGERTYLDLFTIPGLTPRQISVLSASASPTDRTKPVDPDEVWHHPQSLFAPAD